MKAKTKPGPIPKAKLPTQDPHLSLIGMKDIDGNYILCTLDRDFGYSNTSLVLSSNIDYVSVKSMLKYDYKMLTSVGQLESMRVFERKDHAIYTAQELDDFIIRNPQYKLAYIFYPKDRQWQVYELPQQSPLYQFP